MAVGVLRDQSVTVASPGAASTATPDEVAEAFRARFEC